MKNETREDLLSIAVKHLEKIAHLGKYYGTTIIHLTPQIVVTVTLEFVSNLTMLTATFKVFDAKTIEWAEIGAYDEELISKLQHIKENGIGRG